MSVTDGDYVGPAFYRDFASSQDLNAGIGPTITFSRSTSATFVNSQGYIQTVPNNIPRFDYDPNTLQCKGLLIEETRTNLATYSNQLQSWPIITRNTPLPNSLTAPDGTVTATKIVETNVTGSHYIGQGITNPTLGGTYTTSFYVKADTRNFAWIGLSQRTTSGTVIVGELFINFDLVNRTYQSNPPGTGTPPTLVSASIIPAGRGWYRIIVVYTLAASGIDTLNYLVGPATSLSVYSYTGDGVSGIYAWGGQTEAGSFATSYIPTTISSVARNFDSAQVTGSNFTSFYNQNEGTCVVTGRRSLPVGASPTLPRFFQINSTANTGHYIILSRGSQTSITVGATAPPSVNTVYTAGIGSNYAEDNSILKAGMVYSSSGGNGAVNGILGTATNNATLSKDMNALIIGDTGAGIRSFEGCISSIAYYPYAMTPFQLRALTR